MKFFIIAAREITALISLCNLLDITGILRGASELKYKCKRHTGFGKKLKTKDCDKRENWGGDFLSAI